MQTTHSHKTHHGHISSVLSTLGQLFIGLTRTHYSPIPHNHAEHQMAEKMQGATVQQLTTSLRMNGVDGDDEVMLSSLEQMVQAGEIEFSDFIGRVQNLYPHALDEIDVTLRMKIASLLLPRTTA